MWATDRICGVSDKSLSSVATSTIDGALEILLFSSVSRSAMSNHNPLSERRKLTMREFSKCEHQ